MEPRDKLRNLLKAKYKRRWKGKGGKWEYDYSDIKLEKKKLHEMSNNEFINEYHSEDSGIPVEIYREAEKKAKITMGENKEYQNLLKLHNEKTINRGIIGASTPEAKKANNILLNKEYEIAQQLLKDKYEKEKKYIKATDKLSSLLKAKYIKRVPKAGGGYRYYYTKDKGKEKTDLKEYKGVQISNQIQGFIDEFKNDQKTDPLSKEMSLDRILTIAMKRVKEENRTKMSKSDFFTGFTAEKERVENNSQKVDNSQILSQSEFQLKELKIVDDKIKDIMAKGDKEQISLPGFEYDPNAKDSFGRPLSHDNQIESTARFASYIKDAPNFGLATKEELQSEIDTLSKRKKISAKNKELLSRYKKVLNNYDTELSKRKQIVDSLKKNDEINERVKKETKILDKQRVKLQGKLNDSFKKLDGSGKTELRTMMNKIMYNIGKAKELVVNESNNLQKATQIEPWRLQLLKIDNRR